MKIEDGKRLVEITARVWSNGQYSQDLSVGLLIDDSFEYGQGAYKVDSVQVILPMMKTQTTTAELMLI